MTDNTSDPKFLENLARKRLDDAWQEIAPPPPPATPPQKFWRFWDKPPHPNYFEAAECLQRAEQAFKKGDFGDSLKSAVLARDAAAKARLAEELFSKVIGFLVLGLLILYFLWAARTLFSLTYTTCSTPDGNAASAQAQQGSPVLPEAGVAVSETQAITLTQTTSPTQAISPTQEVSLTQIVTPTQVSAPPQVVSSTIPIKLWRWELTRIPCDKAQRKQQSGLDVDVLLWGFLGGVVWCMNGLGYWYSRRLFDKHYLFWYILNPWIAAALGGMFTLTILSGLVPDPKATNSPALLYLVSFTVGLATHDFLKLLVRMVTAVFGQVAPGEKTRQ